MSHLKRTRLRDKFLKDRSDYNKKRVFKTTEINQKIYIIVILLKKRLQIIKLCGRSLTLIPNLGGRGVILPTLLV